MFKVEVKCTMVLLAPPATLSVTVAGGDHMDRQLGAIDADVGAAAGALTR